MTHTPAPPPSPQRYTYFLVAAVIATILLKGGAYWLTDSVALLSDAVESFVNLAAALIALWMLIIAKRPPDEDHAYGHSKADYFAGGLEGTLILVAAVAIAWSAVNRLFVPQALENVGLGLGLAAIALAINFGVAQVLQHAARRDNATLLEADARRLMTDVRTSVGVLAGVGLVGLTGWPAFDPLVALAVEAHIVWSSVYVVRRSVAGLLDSAIPPAERDKLDGILNAYRAEGIAYHSVRTRQAGPRRFINLHVLVPGNWSVKRGHDLVERIERDVRTSYDSPTTVFTHLEPIEDPASMDDIGIDRSV